MRKTNENLSGYSNIKMGFVKLFWNGLMRDAKRSMEGYFFPSS
jgi:hypothetical protein